MKKCKLNAKLIYIDIIIFLFLYMPPIFSFNILNPISLIAVIYLVVNYRQVFRFMRQYLKLKVVFLLMLVFLYTLAIFIFRNDDLAFIYSSIVLPLEVAVISIYIAFFFKKNGYSKRDLVYSLIRVGIVQAVIALAMFIFRDFQNLFIELCIERGFDSSAIEIFRDYRFFGFSSELTFTMPIIQIFIAYLMIFYLKTKAAYEKIIKAVLVVLVLFSAVMNARISIIIIAIIYICYYISIFLSRKKNKSTFRFLNILTVSIVFAVVLLFVINDFFNIKHLDWVLTSIREMLMIFGIQIGQVDKVNTFSMLFGSVQFPTGLDLVFGSGIDIFNNDGYRTDIGYLVNIWYGGILYCGLLFFCLINFLRQYLNDKDKLVITVFIISIFICNVKGNIFNVNSMINFMAMYVFSAYVLNTKKEIPDENKAIAD